MDKITKREIVAASFSTCSHELMIDLLGEEQFFNLLIENILDKFAGLPNTHETKEKIRIELARQLSDIPYKVICPDDGIDLENKCINASFFVFRRRNSGKDKISYS